VGSSLIPVSLLNTLCDYCTQLKIKASVYDLIINYVVNILIENGILSIKFDTPTKNM